MGLEDLKDEILRDSKAKSDAMLLGAKKSADGMIKSADEKIGQMQKASDEDSKRMMDTLKRQELANSELEKKKMILEAKKDAIEEVFFHARSRLEQIDDKKREQYTKKILEKIKKDIDPAYIFCNKKDSKFAKGFEAKNSDFIGGLRAENNDRTIIVDYTFETILEGIKDANIEEITRILFSNF